MVNGATTQYPFSYYEVTGFTVTKYYFAGSQVVALNQGGTLSYLFSDHLGGTAVTSTQAGIYDTELRYKAWGETRYTYGTTPTAKHYTGQYEEAGIGLYFYNARWYDPTLSRFTQADTIIRDFRNPQNYDRFSYTHNNPIFSNDPTGHISENESTDAEKILLQLDLFGVKIVKDWGLLSILAEWENGEWTLSELNLVLISIEDLAAKMGGADKFKSNLGGVTISQKNMKYEGLGDAHKVTLSAGGFTKWTVVHELVHAWDGANSWNLSSSMRSSLGAGFDHPILHFLFPNDPAYWYDPGQGPPPCGVDSNFNPKEDFAEAVTAYAYPLDASAKATANGWPYVDAARGYAYSSYFDTPRGQYIKALMVSNP